ncbi:IS1595 family transposase, partial [Viridibacillus sp. YIM B01967]|nr:IS1595 family transposase [Viridibacillus soli]
MWRYVYEAVGELKKADQLALFKAMKQDLYPKEENKMEKLLP